MEDIISFDSMSDLSSSDDLFHGRAENWEAALKSNKNGKPKNTTTASPANNGGSVLSTQQDMEMDFSSFWSGFGQLSPVTPTELPFEPPVNTYPTIPNGNDNDGDKDTAIENVSNLFQPGAFVSPPSPGGGDVCELQNTLGGVGVGAPSTSEDLSSANFGGIQSSTSSVQENNETAIPQLSQQAHGIHSLSDETDISFLGNSGDASECDAAQKSSLVQLVFVNLQDNLEIGREIIPIQELAKELVEIGELENNGKENQQQQEDLRSLSNGETFMEVESLPPSVAIPDPEIIGNQNVENVEVTEDFQTSFTSTTPKRRGKKPKMHESANLNDPRVKRAKDQYEKREKKKKYDEERENKISDLQAEVVQLKKEVALRDAWKQKLDQEIIKNGKLEIELEAEKKKSEELQAIHDKEVANPVETVKMIDYMKETISAVSKIPNFHLTIPSEVAEARVPLLTGEDMEKIRQHDGETVSGRSLKLTASMSFS
ncbi:unnamed protein product [Orchesella dallaii]|uniref:BZIP domain-containing protein n=1 Tax=Orchesella dallaii TaxID=48710 RepID=A0ABP1RIS8_9HEXA